MATTYVKTQGLYRCNDGVDRVIYVTAGDSVYSAKRFVKMLDKKTRTYKYIKIGRN